MVGRPFGLTPWKQTRLACQGQRHRISNHATSKTSEIRAGAHYGIFAADHGVPHVTLLLFDGKGELRQILRGSQDRADLTPIFEDLMRRHRPRA